MMPTYNAPAEAQPATPALERITVFVTPDIKRAVRIAAALEDISMTEWSSRAMINALPTFALNAPDRA
jgi:hypothetical protein